MGRQPRAVAPRTSEARARADVRPGRRWHGGRPSEGWAGGACGSRMQGATRMVCTGWYEHDCLLHCRNSRRSGCTCKTPSSRTFGWTAACLRWLVHPPHLLPPPAATFPRVPPCPPLRCACPSLATGGATTSAALVLRPLAGPTWRSWWAPLQCGQGLGPRCGWGPGRA